MYSEGAALTFKYNHDGLRTQKVVQQDWYPVTTNYTLHGKLITHMTVDYTDWDEVAQQDVLHFFYDAQSRPAKVSFNGSIYTYIHNLQGDIVGILDSDGELVVEYKYDAWGKLLSTSGTMADTLGKRNPFRYRGYVYDEESGLYYLESRYYAPGIARFLNADGYVATGEDLLDSNMFIYCANSPVMQYDPVGTNCICLYQRVRGNHVCYSTPSYSNDYSSAPMVLNAEHTKNARQSTKNKHQEGQSRKQRDARGEKGDSRRKENRSNKRRNNSSKIVAVGATILLLGAMAYVVINDITGVGAADDAALVPLGAMLWDNLALLF